MALGANAIHASLTRLVFIILEWCMIFLMLRNIFSLKVVPTFIPFCACVALGLIQVSLVYFVIQPYLIDAFVLPTASLSPTIEPGGRFFVNKIIRPRRLDLVAYWNSDARPSVFCKRVIGFPGEHLRFEQGGIYINDQPIELPKVIAGRCHASPSGIPADEARYKDGEMIVLGSNEFFVIGDNVDISVDSRMSGPSHTSSLVGVVDFIYWPLNKLRIMR